MKKLLILTLLFSFYSCKETTEKEIVKKELSIAEKIANAHGYENWSKVKAFQFTFGGKIEDPNSGRSWTWNPKTDDIILVRNGETTSYNRNNMDSLAQRSDRAFINDKFWALIPFQLVWDEGTTFSEVEEVVSPVKKENLKKITILYGSEGGYTPGDAYDIYFDNDYIIREWSYRRANAEEATISNTFENYQDYSGLIIASEHKKSEGDWNLSVRNIKVELEE